MGAIFEKIVPLALLDLKLCFLIYGSDGVRSTCQLFFMFRNYSTLTT
jgi:hypothetical protein